ncbi:MAG: hypothetical protein J6P89_04935, partial [Oscillospiraceae bacterium]|nr:hypothetical protein [Oscillospiraceae bacterium]
HSPNLPVDCYGLIICDRYYDIFKIKFAELNIKPYLMPDNKRLPDDISYHSDLSFFHAGDNRIFASKSYLDEDFIGLLRSSGFEITYFENEQSLKYPFDTGGNVCRFGKYAVLNRQTADPAILKYLDSTDAVQINVKQGYTKCSICVLDKNSIITGDRVTAEKAAEKGIDVLFSDPAFIKLNGFSHGFIGGSTFKIASDKLCFTGVLDAFPDHEKDRILGFCEKKGIEPVFLTDRPLFDIGGAVPVLER